jgi:hypothetical protein
MKHKKTVLTLILSVMVNMGLLAQGQPVMDITAIMTAVQNGSVMVEQLQTMYTTVKTSYEQLQRQIKNFESFDFNKLDAKDPLGSWKSLNTYVERMMTYEKNIETIINRKDIKIGESKYSLKDVFASPNKTMQDMLVSGATFVVDPLDTKLTAEEKSVFHQKYGMSHGNYMRINQIGEMLKKKSAEVIGYSDNLQENLLEDRERLEAIMGDLFEGESIIQQQQINNAVMSIMAQDMKTQAKLTGDIATQLAANFSQAQIMKEAMQAEININDLDLSEGIMKMLDGMEPLNAYR